MASEWRFYCDWGVGRQGNYLSMLVNIAQTLYSRQVHILSSLSWTVVTTFELNARVPLGVVSYSCKSYNTKILKSSPESLEGAGQLAN